jgi:hypothetical protein
VAEAGNEKEVGSKVRWPRQVMKRKQVASKVAEAGNEKEAGGK